MANAYLLHILAIKVDELHQYCIMEEGTDMVLAIPLASVLFSPGPPLVAAANTA